MFLWGKISRTEGNRRLRSGSTADSFSWSAECFFYFVVI